jgi:hypothetical protein
MRDKALQRWLVGEANSRSPVAKKYPDGMANTLVLVSGATRTRIYRWLDNPDRFPLEWSELTRIAEELGGHLKCMFSERD